MYVASTLHALKREKTSKHKFPTAHTQFKLPRLPLCSFRKILGHTNRVEKGVCGQGQDFTFHPEADATSRYAFPLKEIKFKAKYIE